MRQSAGSVILLGFAISLMMSVGRICAFTSRSTPGRYPGLSRVSRITQPRPSTLTTTSSSTSRLMMASSRTIPSMEPTKVPPKQNDGKLSSSTSNASHDQPPMMNLYTISKEDLEEIVQLWGYPRYRADQVYHWIREKGVVDAEQMVNLPKKLRSELQSFSSSGGQQQQQQPNDEVESIAPGKIEPNDIVHSKASTSGGGGGGALTLVQEQVSPKDGTIKRLYQLRDGYLIESVLMPYDDGRWTSCISSQAGCAQGCVFCATGQMGFQRQLTADEIVEQVTRFSTHLRSAPPTQPDQTKGGNKKQQNNQHSKQQRLSNIVFMGEGEPLANFRNVMEAVPRIQDLAGIGARKITISTVGVVPNIRKLMASPIQVRLAVSLHCASDEERSALIPANRRYGGLNELMTTLYDYIETTGRRLTLEWALIGGENDTPETAYKLGNLLRKYRLRRDMVHINVIPLNPTGGYAGSASGRKRVNEFCRILEEEFGVACTPRVRRGIDIDAGCGQLKSKALLEEELKAKNVMEEPIIINDVSISTIEGAPATEEIFSFDFATVVDLDSDDIQYNDDDEIMDETFDADEASRLLGMVKGTVLRDASVEDENVRP